LRAYNISFLAVYSNSARNAFIALPQATVFSQKYISLFKEARRRPWCSWKIYQPSIDSFIQEANTTRKTNLIPVPVYILLPLFQKMRIHDFTVVFTFVLCIWPFKCSLFFMLHYVLKEKKAKKYFLNNSNPNMLKKAIGGESSKLVHT